VVSAGTSTAEGQVEEWPGWSPEEVDDANPARWTGNAHRAGEHKIYKDNGFTKITLNSRKSLWKPFNATIGRY